MLKPTSNLDRGLVVSLEVPNGEDEEGGGEEEDCGRSAKVP